MKAEECAAYFRADPAWRRPMEQLLKKYSSYGRCTGTISLPDATREECEAARGLFGRSFSAPLCFQAAGFEAALQETKYRGVMLKELLEAYFDCEIRTKNQTQQESEARIAQALAQAKADSESESCRAWLDALREKSGNGYPLLSRSISAGQAVDEALSRVCRSAAWLETHPGQPIRLAVLSARSTSDPHALDAKTLCGDLFLHYLSWRAGCQTPALSEDRDALFYQSGIVSDSIASSVTQVGLILYTEKGEHPAFRAFREQNEACTLTLANLARLTAGESPSGRAYLVENQMVFSQLCDRAEVFTSPLICTSGQPQVAVLRLLDLLDASGTALYYSGDFDGKGLSIPSQLLRRYPDRFHLWHMDPADYQRSRSEKHLSDQSIQLLKTCAPMLQPTAQEILKKQRAGYQELLLPLLLQDLTDTR